MRASGRRIISGYFNQLAGVHVFWPLDDHIGRHDHITHSAARPGVDVFPLEDGIDGPANVKCQSMRFGAKKMTGSGIGTLDVSFGAKVRNSRSGSKAGNRTAT